MGRRADTAPTASAEDARAYEEWCARWTGRFASIWAPGYGPSLPSLLASQVAWAPESPVSRHALAIGAVDLNLLEEHRRALGEARGR